MGSDPTPEKATAVPSTPHAAWLCPPAPEGGQPPLPRPAFPRRALRISVCSRGSTAAAAAANAMLPVIGPSSSATRTATPNDSTDFIRDPTRDSCHLPASPCVRSQVAASLPCHLDYSRLQLRLQPCTSGSHPRISPPYLPTTLPTAPCSVGSLLDPQNGVDHASPIMSIVFPRIVLSVSPRAQASGSHPCQTSPPHLPTIPSTAPCSVSSLQNPQNGVDHASPTMSRIFPRVQ